MFKQIQSQILVKSEHGLKWILIAGIVGVFAGVASAAFLVSLQWATSVREAHSWLIWLLPFAGLAVGWLYHLLGKEIAGGNNLLIDEIHQPKASIPFRMAPLVLIGTVITHLFGGSAGREGTAVQMGGSIADQFSRPFGMSPRERRTLLMAGISGGFGSVFGVPFAGALFGIEVLSIGRLYVRGVFECLVASVVGHFTVLALGVHHTVYAAPLVPELSLQTMLWISVAGVAFGLCARMFSALMHGLSRIFNSAVRYAPLRPTIGGAIVAIGFWLLGTTRYAGLGITVIEDSLRMRLSPWDFALKSVFTVLSLGSGFKGGEVTPLLFIGSTFGNALSKLIPLPFSTLSAVGFVAVFAGAANTPITCTIMAMEIFGPGIGVFAAIGCLSSYFVSGHKGIYRAQRIRRDKRRYFLSALSRSRRSLDPSCSTHDP